MKKNIEKTILEMFGDPIEPKMGMKIGDLPGITTIGAVGVKDMNEDDLGDICSTCGMMSLVMDEPCSCAMTEAKKRKVQPRRPQRRF